MEIMEKEDEFLFNYFTSVSQICFDKAKEHVEKEKVPKSPVTPWTTFLNFLQQLSLAEKSYIDIGFLQNKQKSFLRKDNSLRASYENFKTDLRKIEDGCKNNNQRLQNYCQNITQFLSARVNLIDLYEKIYNLAMTNKHMSYVDILNSIETIIQNNHLGFTDISLTPMKAVFSLECEVLQQLFKAMHELQRLQFLPSLALVHGAHTRLFAWESKMQRGTWKLGIFKNSPLPALFQWLQKLKGSVLSKLSLYFHDTLANQTTPTDMRHLCSKLQHDYYQKMVTFQRKHDAACVILLSDNQANCDTADYDSFPIIVSYPPKPPQLETILKMLSETNEFLALNKPITKFRLQVSSMIKRNFSKIPAQLGLSYTRVSLNDDFAQLQSKNGHPFSFLGSMHILFDHGRAEYLLCDLIGIQKVRKRHVDREFYQRFLYQLKMYKNICKFKKPFVKCI